MGFWADGGLKTAAKPWEAILAQGSVSFLGQRRPKGRRY